MITSVRTCAEGPFLALATSSHPVFSIGPQGPVSGFVRLKKAIPCLIARLATPETEASTLTMPVTAHLNIHLYTRRGC
jgi:hypothetical protein